MSVVLGGCTPGPAPKPTLTPMFTSEADAFKAAEQVYRDYVDAANAAQNGDKSASPKKYLAGTAFDEDVQSDRDFEAAGLRITGQSTVKSFEAKEYDGRSQAVDAVACLDVSGSRVVNGAGQDVTPANRAPFASIKVRLVPGRDSLKIVKLAPSTDPCS